MKLQNQIFIRRKVEEVVVGQILHVYKTLRIRTLCRILHILRILQTHLLRQGQGKGNHIFQTSGWTQSVIKRIEEWK